MDSGEGGGDGGGGEERDAAAAAADLHPQPLSPPLLIPEVIPEQGSSSHTSAVDPAKEPLAVPHPRPEGAEGSPARERTQGGAAGAGWGGGGHLQGIGGCQEQGMKEEEGRREGCLFELGTESEEEHASAGEEEHLSCTPSSAAALPSETEVRDIKGDRGWISGFPLSFKSQQSASASPPTRPSEDDRPAGVPRSSFANEGGAKAPEPNVSQPEREVEEEEEDGDGGGGGSDGGDRAVLRSLNHDLSPGSLTSHMTIMHSRNSCKTLKCPKCNWHYKSQHTLQLHMREKHPETSGPCVCSGGGSGGKCVCGGGAAGGACAYCSSGKAHPRLARGETYACGYKPYRCEVCDYATSSKGNLSIHMQSDKHLNNVQSGGHANGGGGGVVVSQSHSPDEQVYKLALPLHAPSASQPAKQASPPAPQQAHSLGKRWRCDVCDYETSIARNLRIHTTSEKHTHNMLRLQRGFYLSHCRSLPPGLKHLQSPGGELPLGLHASGQAIPEASLATLGSTLTPSPSPSPSPPLAPPLSPTGALSPGVFHCLVCSGFSSDSLESVEQHLGAPRSLPQAEWCSLVAGGCHCRLCAYTTPLRANFSLHCQTDRHRARYQLAAHLREGGDRAPEEVAAMVAKGNPVQLRCNLCDYVTSSLEKLRGHALSAHHEASVRVYRQYDGDVDGGAWLFHCLLCSHSCSSKVQLLKHSQTATHQQREGLLQLQPMGGEELAAIFTIRKSPDGVREDGRFAGGVAFLLSRSMPRLQQPLPLLVSGCLAVFQQLDLRGAGVAAQEAVEEPRPSINIAIVLLEKLNHRNKSHVRKARNTDAHAGLMMSAERVSSELLQAAGHVVAQVASQLHRVALGDHGGHLLWGPVSSQLVPGAVPWQPPATREHHSAWGRERGAPRCCSTDSRLSEEKPEQTRQWKTPGERAPVGDRGGASGGEGEGDGEGVFEAWRQAPAVGQVAGDAGLVVAHVTSPPLAEGVGLLRRWRRGLLGGLAGGWSVQRQCQFVDLLVRRVALGDHHTAAAAICMASTLHVVEVFVRLHVDAEVAFGRGGIVAHLAAVSPRAKRGWALPELQYAHAPPAAPPPHTHFPPEPPPEHTHGPLVSGCFSRMCSCRRSWLRLLRTALSPPSLPPPPPSPSSSSSSTSLSGWLTFGSGALAPPSLAKEERGTPAGLSSSLGLVGGEAEADCWDLKLKGKPEIQPRSPLMAAAEEGVQERCFGGEGERGGGRRSGGEQGFGRAVALPSSVPLGAARRYMAHIGALMNRKAERQKE
ncbi:hypothetical protein CRUP_015848 [Coryphaenoides rupestris]|nr:hypothetical protein CRUP_015848 [Coryphaenoides rupestris]